MFSPSAADGPKMSSSNTDQAAEERDETAANRDRKDEEEQSDLSEEYKKWKNQTSEVLGCLDQLRQSLDDRTVQVRAKSLRELFENADDVEAVRNEMEMTRKMLCATDKYLVEDVSSSLAAIRRSLATYSQVTRDKLNDERKAPGTSVTLSR